MKLILVSIIGNFFILEDCGSPGFLEFFLFKRPSQGYMLRILIKF